MDLETKIIELGETCAGIKSELSGMQDLMKRLTDNQVTLIALTQRHEHTEEKLNKMDKALGKNFDELRCLQAQRLGPRVKELEDSGRWRRVTFYLTIISASVGGVTLWVRKMLE